MCGLSSEHMIGVYFFENEHHDNHFFLLTLHGIDVYNGWFQQDEATCHTLHLGYNRFIVSNV